MAFTIIGTLLRIRAENKISTYKIKKDTIFPQLRLKIRQYELE